MPQEYHLPQQLRSRLATPLGRLFTKSEIDSGSLSATLSGADLVVTVGDRVTETLARLGRVPDVQIVDGKENRTKRKPPDVTHSTEIAVRNSAATISDEAIKGIREAFRKKRPVRILVEGEEDLLAIPALVFAPDGASVYYGQPGRGIVLVKADRDEKARSRRIMSQMGIPDSP